MLTFDQMKELIHLVATNRLAGVELRQADFHFQVRGTEPLPDPAGNAAVSGLAEGSEEAGAAPLREPQEPEGHVLTSPIVGTFYTAPSPDAEPYVGLGDRVQKGQVLCIVEAMKLMNEIESDVSGVIVEIIPENAQPVEFGEPLFRIRTD